MTTFKIGEIIGQRFEINKILGEGAFGEVYLVYDIQLQTVLALKTFREPYLSNVEVRQKFLQEANILVDLGRHPFLVEVYFVDQSSGRLFIAMQYISSDELRPNTIEKYLRRNLPEIGIILRWAIQICIGISYTYSKGIKCHGDIKSSNILIGQDNNIKISDFGQAIIHKDYLQRLHAQTAFKEGYSVGEKISPEIGVLPLPDCDKYRDIYAFGLLLYELVTGTRPIGSSLNYAYDDQGGIASSELRIEPMDSVLFPIIFKCILEDISKRYHSFEDIKKDLENLFLTLTGEVVSIPDQREFTISDLNNMGNSFNNLGRYSQAIELFEEVLKIDPFCFPAWNNKGNSLEKLNRNSEAIVCYDKALEINPKDALAWHNKGLCLANLGNYIDAIMCLDNALKLNPRDAVAYNTKGRCLAELEKYYDAISCFNDSIRLDPQYSNPRKNKSICLRRMGRYDEAIAELDGALKINPLDASLWNSKGNCYSEQGKESEAIQYYEKALEINPIHKNTIDNLKRCLNNLAQKS